MTREPLYGPIRDTGHPGGAALDPFGAPRAYLCRGILRAALSPAANGPRRDSVIPTRSWQVASS